VLIISRILHILKTYSFDYFCILYSCVHIWMLGVSLLVLQIFTNQID